MKKDQTNLNPISLIDPNESQPIKITIDPNPVSSPGVKEQERNTYYTPYTCKDIRELSNIIQLHNWSACEEFTGHQRSATNATRANLLAFDIDSGMSLEDAQKAVSHLKHIIGTSGSHQQIKHPGTDREQPACDRFRVILFPESPIPNNNENRHWYSYYNQLLFQGLADPSPKDIGRLWYTCKQIVSVKEKGDLLSTPPEKEQQFTPVNTPRNHPPTDKCIFEKAFDEATFNNSKGMLFPVIEEWLKQPWDNSGEDHEMKIKALHNIKKNGYNKEEAHQLFLQKGPDLDEKTLRDLYNFFEADKYGDVDPYLPKEEYNSNYLDAIYFLDVADEKTQVIRMSKKDHSFQSINTPKLKSIIGEKALQERLETGLVSYDPYAANFRITKNTAGDKILNNYNPPDWKKDLYFKNAPIEINPVMPPEYDDFLTYLTAGCQKSKNYIIQWMANSLRGYQIQILALIGAERGIGKGVLSNILYKLHGESNSGPLKQSFIDSKFNSGAENKSFVFLDEVYINNEDAISRIKVFTNPTVSLESKGINEIKITNHLNIMMANNDPGSLVGFTHGDRQFSIPNLATKEMGEYPSFLNGRHVTTLYNDPDLINKLASYLWTLGYKSQKPLTNTEQYETVVDQSMKAWERCLLYTFPSMFNTDLPFTANFIQKGLTNAIEMERPPGINKIESFASKYSDKIVRKKYKVNHERPILFFIRKNEETQSEFKERVRNFKKEDALTKTNDAFNLQFEILTPKKKTAKK